MFRNRLNIALITCMALFISACSSYSHRSYDDRGYGHRGHDKHGHYERGNRHRAAYSDRDIYDQVHYTLANNIHGSRISINVRNRVVYLSGHVPNRREYRRARALAYDVPGVREVRYDRLRIH